MKKYLYIFSLFVFSCGGGSDSDEITTPQPAEVNVAPTIPSLVYPTNDLLCVDNVLEFKWNASTDDNGDNITYTVEVSKTNGFSNIDFSSTVSTTTKIFTLEKGIAYYWRVKAKDNKNATSSYSSIFNLYTEGLGESNHLPFSPVLISPSLGANDQEGDISLSWSASDTDGDDLTFDVYFDTNNPPMVLVSKNQVETTVDVTVSASIDYYWKIVVKDDNDGQTIGQVWSFKTN